MNTVASYEPVSKFTLISFVYFLAGYPSPSPYSATHLPNLATHLPNLATHLPNLATHLSLISVCKQLGQAKDVPQPRNLCCNSTPATTLFKIWFP